MPGAQINKLDHIICLTLGTKSLGYRSNTFCKMQWLSRIVLRHGCRFYV